jgi:hypothetical protein
MFVCCECCLLSCRGLLRRADHSSRGVLPTIVRRCVWPRNLKNEEAMNCVRSQRHKKKFVQLICRMFITIYQLPPHFTELLAAGWNYLYWKLKLQCLWYKWYNSYLTILLVDQNK